jgi:hypothetical protein
MTAGSRRNSQRRKFVDPSAFSTGGSESRFNRIGTWFKRAVRPRRFRCEAVLPRFRAYAKTITDPSMAKDPEAREGVAADDDPGTPQNQSGNMVAAKKAEQDGRQSEESQRAIAAGEGRPGERQSQCELRSPSKDRSREDRTIKGSPVGQGSDREQEVGRLSPASRPCRLWGAPVNACRISPGRRRRPSWSRRVLAR